MSTHMTFSILLQNRIVLYIFLSTLLFFKQYVWAFLQDSFCNSYSFFLRATSQPMSIHAAYCFSAPVTNDAINTPVHLFLYTNIGFTVR